MFTAKSIGNKWPSNALSFFLYSLPSVYRKVPKFSDTKNLCCKLPKIQTKRQNLWAFYQNGAKGNSKQWRPWSDCSSRSSLIWVCTVCPDISVRKLRVITGKFCFLIEHENKLHGVKTCLWGFRPGPTLDCTARFLEFQILKAEGIYYLCSENKRADQLCCYCPVDLCLCFIHANNRFTHHFSSRPSNSYVIFLIKRYPASKTKNRLKSFLKIKYM